MQWISLSFQIQIENWIKNGYTFLFLGYSGGDALDVNPFFQRLKDDIGNTAIFIKKQQRISQEMFAKTSLSSHNK